jgi:hypothetical protein
MPKPRKSLAQLSASGTLAKNKGRYADRIAAIPTVLMPIGKPPRHLPTDERALWAELVKAAPPGLLQRSDRIALEVACKLVARMRTADAKTSELNALMATLGKLGVSPLDRLRLNLEPPPPEPSAQDALWAELDELD